MKTIGSVLSAALIAVVTSAAFVVGSGMLQDAKPTVAPVAVANSTEFKLSNMSEVDALKLQNIILRMNNIAKDIQTLQTQFDTMGKTEWPALIKTLRTTYNLPENEWELDPNALVFKRVKKPDPEAK